MLSTYTSKQWEEIEVGEILNEIQLPVTVRRVVLDAAATRDFFPGHHDRDYARAQGVSDMYLNTMFFQGFVDRVVTNWSGPEAFIVRRKINMRVSIPAGDMAIGSGSVAGKREDDGHKLVDLKVDVKNQAGVIACTAEVTIAVRSYSKS